MEIFMSNKNRPTFQSLYEEYCRNVKAEHEKLSKNSFAEKLNSNCIQIPETQIPEHIQGILFNVPRVRPQKKTVIRKRDIEDTMGR
jgi:hypothetical protein